MHGIVNWRNVRTQKMHTTHKQVLIDIMIVIFLFCFVSPLLWNVMRVQISVTVETRCYYNSTLHSTSADALKCMTLGAVKEPLMNEGLVVSFFNSLLTLIEKNQWLKMYKNIENHGIYRIPHTPTHLNVWRENFTQQNTECFFRSHLFQHFKHGICICKVSASVYTFTEHTVQYWITLHHFEL